MVCWLFFWVVLHETGRQMGPCGSLPAQDILDDVFKPMYEKSSTAQMSNNSHFRAVSGIYILPLSYLQLMGKNLPRYFSASARQVVSA